MPLDIWHVSKWGVIYHPEGGILIPQEPLGSILRDAVYYINFPHMMVHDAVINAIRAKLAEPSLEDVLHQLITSDE